MRWGRGILVVVAVASVMAGVAVRASGAEDVRKVGKLTVTNNLSEKQDLLSMLIKRKLPNGKEDTSRESVTRGKTKSITLPYGSYTVDFSRRQISGGGTMYTMHRTKTFEISEANAEQVVTMAESDMAAPGKSSGGKQGTKKK